MALNKSIAQDTYSDPIIETARVLSVNTDKWTVDCASDTGNRQFLEIPISAPYLHYANGEGIYAMPEVGALVWVCTPSGGEFAAPFVMGFQAPHDLLEDGYRAGRPTLNPGDIALKTRDENFVLLRRGGVVQIGATSMAQRIYLPIQNFIRDFAENYQLFSLAGSMEWVTDRDDKTTEGAAPTSFILKAKSAANQPGHVAKLQMGFHKADDPTTLTLQIFESGAEDAVQKVSLTIQRDGNVAWILEGGWTLEAEKNIQVKSRDGDISIITENRTVSVTAKDLTMTTTKNATIDAGGKVVIKATEVVVDAPVVKLGGSGASQALIKGNELVSLLTDIISKLGTAVSGPPGSPVVACQSILPLIGKLPSLLSTNTFTK